MADPLFDDLLDLLCLARVVELRSFSAAARRLGVSKSVTSARVARLEERLGERLVIRSTRKLSVTDPGMAVYGRAARMLEEAGAAVRGGSASGEGHIRLNAPVSLAQMYLAPPLAAFLRGNPGIHVELELSDRLVDVVEERVDVALRVTKLRDSTSLVARRLGRSPLGVYGSPEYLARRGRPERPEDLLEHDCLRYTHLRAEEEWRFHAPGGRLSVPVRGPLSAGNGGVLGEAAAAGIGLAVLPGFIATPAVRAGKLVRVLEKFAPRPIGIYAVRAAGRTVPPRVRRLLDALAAAFAADEAFE